jgi:predicted nucleic acid-binding protein
MQVLVDTSVWIDYFRGDGNADSLDFYIDENLVAVNDLILAELVPFLRLKNQQRLIRLLNAVHRLTLSIRWEEIMAYQYRCLKKGINGFGIPDFIIAQNAVQHRVAIYSLDNHFELMKSAVPLVLAE